MKTASRPWTGSVEYEWHEGEKAAMVPAWPARDRLHRLVLELAAGDILGI
jgi:hypothetical protein